LEKLEESKGGVKLLNVRTLRVVNQRNRINFGVQGGGEKILVGRRMLKERENYSGQKKENQKGSWERETRKGGLSF